MCSTLQQPTPTYTEPHARHFVVVAVLKWEAAEEAIHQIVTHSDDQFSLTYEDLKKMLDWKDRLEELSVKCKTLVSYLVSCSRLGRPCHIELLRARARVCLFSARLFGRWYINLFGVVRLSAPWPHFLPLAVGEPRFRLGHARVGRLRRN